MMNRDLEGGTYIALKGRVPVKIIGSVKKGDNLIAANDGCASVAVHHSSEVFAVALESNSDTSVKLVEAVIL
jgi:predicted solute-binding protein